MYYCKHCNKKYENPKSVASHTKWCKENPNKQTPFKEINIKCDVRTKINESINKDLNLIEKRRITLINLYATGKLKSPIGKSLTKEGEVLRRKKISQSMKNNPDAGGLRKGAGHGIKGTYKGHYCDSTWELAWVIYHIDKSIKFTRNKEGFEYVYLEKTYKYYPDFIINDVYYEIKGRRSYNDLDEKSKAKISNFKKPLVVLYQNDMQHILEYVINTYGTNFTLLYE
jgi:hypothetical protein